MKKEELQRYLEEQIPLYRKTGFTIEELKESSVQISGTLEENSNPHKTLFGGSIGVILLMAAWSKAYELMNRTDPHSSIVVSSQKIDYIKPVTNNFHALATNPESDILQNFLQNYETKGKGKLNVIASLYENGSHETAALFTGEFYIKKR